MKLSLFRQHFWTKHWVFDYEAPNFFSKHWLIDFDALKYFRKIDNFYVIDFSEKSIFQGALAFGSYFCILYRNDQIYFAIQIFGRLLLKLDFVSNFSEFEVCLIFESK